MTVASAYPAALDALMPQARDLAESIGDTPSQNRLMKELKIGKDKARTIRQRLTADLTHTTETSPAAPADPVPATDPIDAESVADPAPVAEAAEMPPLVTDVADPVPSIISREAAEKPATGRKPVAWPVLLLALPAFVAIWSGWVELGERCGFGVVHPLPGIADDFQINSAITLPIGVETYAAYALWVWLSARVTGTARTFAKWSAIASLVVGAAGQVAYHLMAATGIEMAPWWITTLVACLPVAVLGMGAALAHLVHAGHR
jgi:hypothetical protein